VDETTTTSLFRPFFFFLQAIFTANRNFLNGQENSQRIDLLIPQKEKRKKSQQIKMRRSLALLGLALSGVSQAQNSNGDIAQLIASQPDLSQLAFLLTQVPDLASSLASSTNITILAPTNEALDAVNRTLSTLNLKSIRSIISYHVLNGTYYSSNLTNIPTFVPTLFNSTFTNGADRPLTNVTTGQHVGLVVDQGNSSSSDGTGEVVVISGDLQTSRVVEANITASNSSGIVIHKIDTVLTLPDPISETALDLGLLAAVGALQTGELVETVNNTPNITAFIPTNEAFEAVGSLFANTSLETLRDVLRYHVIPDAVLFSPNISNSSVSTLQGNNLNLTVINSTVYANSAKVVIPNVIVANGVIHVIDGVLNPNGTSSPEGLNPSSSGAPAFSGASSGSVSYSTIGPTATTTISATGILTEAPAASSGGAAGGGEGSSDTSEGAAPTAAPYGVLPVGAIIAGAYMML
jgi:uncharacterized surface protein with fasciclin (FAS1) repeats